MTLSDFRRITDELLSAYIDDEVTEQERALIEAAIAQDEEIAWRLNSLRQTVTLLHDLPELALPRSFALTLDQVTQANEQMAGVGAMERQAVAQESVMRPAASPRLQRQVAPTPEAGFWQQVAEGWRRFWQGGNPMLRNAAAVSFALMLFLAGGGQLLNRALTQPAGMMATAVEAPAAAPAASEAMPETQAVAIAPTATEAALQVQDDSSLKAPDEGAPAEESARVMQAPAEGASDAPQAATEQTTEAASAESVVAESATAETTEDEDSAAPASDAAAAAASDAPAPTATLGEPSVAAAMAAPIEPQGDAMPPLVPNPLPGGGSGARPESGGGMGGGGPEGPESGETGNLVPEEVYGFDVNPVGGPTPLPADEGVTASVAAAPAEAAAASAADVAVTPAVDEVPEEEVAAASVASESVASDVAATEMPATDAAAIAATTEPTAVATPEAVAVVAPGAITSSEIVENVETEDATPATGAAGNVPVVWVAQGTAFLLTIVLASLWWRSRTPRRPRRS